MIATTFLPVAPQVFEANLESLTFQCRGFEREKGRQILLIEALVKLFGQPADLLMAVEVTEHSMTRPREALDVEHHPC